MGAREEDGLVLAREDTAARFHVEDGVKWRLNIRNHFPALAGIWAAEPAPGASCEPPLRGQAAAQRGAGWGDPWCGLHARHTTTAGISHILFFFLNFNASSRAWQQGLLQLPRPQRSPARLT